MDHEDDHEEVFTSEDPFDLFRQWMSLAEAKEINDPNALALATVSEDGMPNVRMVLLKGYDERGFVFYTNYESDKGREILGTSKAAMCFHWKSLRRQVRLQGPTEPVSDEEANEYFESRHKDSQIGAWASQQSRPLKGRFELEKQVAKYAAKYALKKVDRPPHWSGFRIKPVRIEFWRNRLSRLHDRKVFTRDDPGIDKWCSLRLYP